MSRRPPSFAAIGIFSLAVLGGWGAGTWHGHIAPAPVPALSIPPGPGPAPAAPLADSTPGPAFLNGLEALKAGDFPRILTERALKPGTPLSTLEDYLILAGWVGRDPAACTAWLMAAGRQSDLRAALVAWAKSSPAGAWRAMAALPLTGRDRTECLKTLGDSLIARDADGFLQLPPGGWIEEKDLLPFRQSALWKLAWKNPELALTRLSGIIPGDSLTLQNIARIWGQNDPAAALAWSLAAGTDPEKAATVQSAAISGLAKKDPEAAAAFLESRSDLLHGPMAQNDDPRAAVAAGLAATSLKRSMEWLEQFTPGEQTELVRGIRSRLPPDISRWVPDFTAAVADPALRLTLLEAVLRGGGSSDLLDYTAEGLTMNKLQDIPSTPEWRMATKALAAEFVRLNTAGNVEKKIAGLHGPIRTALVLAAAQKQSLPADSPALVNSLAENAAWLTPEEITGIFKTSSTTGSALLNKLGYVENYYSGASAVWAAQNAPAAAIWVAGLPDERARQEAAGPLITAWCRTDELAASQWIAAQPPGAMRDEAAASLAAGLITTSPADSWVWLMSLSNPASKTSQLQQTAASWLKADPDTARAAISAAALSQEIRDQLLHPAPTP